MNKTLLCSGTGIIPPYMEGTEKGHVPARHKENHPSVYGGYATAFSTAVSAMESSLRIRRVRFGNLRPDRCARNHPSAYGGYDTLPRVVKFTKESSLRIRRVRGREGPSGSTE